MLPPITSQLPRAAGPILELSNLPDHLQRKWNTMRVSMRLGVLVGLMATLSRPWRVAAAPRSVALQPFSE